jgi:hypothetical protein
MNCRKYKHKATIQKQTWLTRLPSYIRYYHVIGDETLDNDFSFNDEINVLHVKVADDYNSLPKKVITAYKAVLQTFDIKYIFKTDDDQILLKDCFFDILKGLIDKEHNIHYGGFIVDVKQNHLSQYHKIHPELPEYLPILKTRYCSGRFYFLSKFAIVNLVSKLSSIEKEYFEDYAIGYHLDNVYKTNMLPILTNNYFIDIEKSKYANY